MKRMVQKLHMIFKAIPRARWTFGLMVFGSLFLASCDDIIKSEPNYYYQFSFEAEVEGEFFSINTKVACKAYSAGSGHPTKNYTIFLPKLNPYSKKLTSGKGFFVIPPNMCSWLNYKESPPQWELPRDKEVYPVMFFSDVYENVHRIELLVSPKGPAPKSEIKILTSKVRPLFDQDLKEIKFQPQLDNNPLKGVKKQFWSGYFLYQLNSKDLPLDKLRLISSEENFYEVYEEIELTSRHPIIKESENIWLNFSRGLSIDQIFSFSNPPDFTNKEQNSSISEKIKQNFETSKVVIVKNSEILTLPGKKGFVGLYENGFLRNFEVENAVEKFSITLDEEIIEIDSNIKSVEKFIFINKETGEIFKLKTVTLGMVFDFWPSK